MKSEILDHANLDQLDRSTAATLVVMKGDYMGIRRNYLTWSCLLIIVPCIQGCEKPESIDNAAQEPSSSQLSSSNPVAAVAPSTSPQAAPEPSAVLSEKLAKETLEAHLGSPCQPREAEVSTLYEEPLYWKIKNALDQHLPSLKGGPAVVSKRMDFTYESGNRLKQATYYRIEQTFHLLKVKGCFDDPNVTVLDRTVNPMNQKEVEVTYTVAWSPDALGSLLRDATDGEGGRTWYRPRSPTEERVVFRYLDSGGWRIERGRSNM